MSLATFLYSQVGFPKIINLSGDSVVAITFEQVKKINLVKAESDSYKQISDSLLIQVDLYKQQNVIGINMIENMQKQLSLKDSLIKKDAEIQSILRNDNDFLKNKIKKEKTFKTIIYIVGSGIIAGLTGTTIYFGTN